MAGRDESVGFGDDVIAIEDRLHGLVPNGFGLYPHEVLMLTYADGLTTETRRFQQFWWYQYGVREPRNVLESLRARGFLAVGGLREAVELQTVASLKVVLAGHGLKVSGRKSELVERVLSNVQPGAVREAFPGTPYSLTAKGVDARRAGEFISYIHRKPHITSLNIFSAAELLAQHDGSWRDLLWAHFQEQSRCESKQGRWGFYRNTRLNMAKFMAEDARYLAALELLAEVCYYDLSGMGNHFSMAHLDIHREYFFLYGRSTATLAPGVVAMVFDWAIVARLGADDVRTLFRKRLSQMSSPLRLFTDEQIIEIIFLERQQATAALTDMYAAAERSFTQRYG